jgi:hypothetical protein
LNAQLIVSFVHSAASMSFDTGQAMPATSNIAAIARRSSTLSPRFASARGTPITRSPRPVCRTRPGPSM